MKIRIAIKAALSVLFSLSAIDLWATAPGDIVLSSYWQDHMVLQRGKPITVWGRDIAGRAVTVAFAGQQATAVTGADGLWEATFAQPFALSSTPRTLTVSDNAGGVRDVTDILVGDVFLAAGQSNMDRRLEDPGKVYYEPQSVKDFCRDDDGIRFIRIARSAENTTAGEQLFDLPPHKAVNDAIKYFGEGYDWSPAVGTNRNYVSALALNFARYVRDSNSAKGQDIPVGIIHASSGGTAIRQWLSPAVLRANGYSAEVSDGWYWNNMMAPILRAKFCAVLWYQGCSDAGKTAEQYKGLMDVLVRDRRERWGENGDLPFYAVQIGTPGYANGEIQTMNLDKYPAPTEINNGQNYAIVREAQRLWDASETGAHGLAVIVDHVRCMTSGDLHPADKNFVARRLSLFARRDLYGEPDLQADGPVFSRAVREPDGKVRLHFKPGTAKGLTSGRLKMAGELTLSRFVKDGGPVRGFALCGADGVWKEAEAIVDGETVVLRADGLATPTRFHYGYWCITRTDNMEFGQRLSLYNGEGLPLSPLAPMAVEDANAGAKVADPVLSPASGLFSPSTNVTLSCATTGATIRYTLNGDAPTASSPAYAAPLALSATTTVKARAFAAGKEASDVVSATYTLGTPPEPVPDPLWSVRSYVPSDWAPLANNILAGKTGTTAGGLAWGTMSKDASNLTDGVVPVAADESKLVGFCDGASISWTFGEPQTITSIRISTRRATGGDEATAHKYAGVHLQDVYVKRSGSTDWEPLNAALYEKSGAPVGTIEAVLADDGAGRLAEGVTGLKIVFLKGEVVWCNVAEIEASGYATAEGPTEPLPTVANPTFSPASCSFYPSTNVTLSCATADATIRYTLDGGTPTASSTAYTAPIALSATTTVRARAFAEGMNPSAVASATYTRTAPASPDPPPEEPPVGPSGESNRTWTSGDYAPSAWTALGNNILAGLTATAVDAGKLSFAASKDLSKLTDGAVSATAASTEIVGLCAGAKLVWTFDEPKILEKIRFSSLWSSKIYAGISISDILVQTSGASDWVSLGMSFNRSGNATADSAQYALLSDPGLGYLALDVVALKVVFGNVEAFANYYAEIEAAGRKSSEGPSYPPTLDALKVTSWGASAEFSGSVVSAGTGASSCDVYLACGPDAEHLGEPARIYSGNAGAFHYELGGLDLNTTYAYCVSATNDASPAAGCSMTGTFTTTAEIHPDWSACKWAVIGDSLSDPTLDPVAAKYYDFVVRDTGIQLVYTNAVGGTGYKNRYNQNAAFCQRLAAAPLPSDVDVVTIFGSVNDWGQARDAASAGSPADRLPASETLAAYMNKAIDLVREQAPNARLVLVGSLYYYNVVETAHIRANETLRAVAAARGIAFYDWLTENADDPLDFHQIADNPLEEGSFAQRYTRDCPAAIVPGETQFGHPSAEYHEAWLSPHFRGILATALAQSAPIALGEAVARPSTNYNGNAVSVTFSGEIPEGAAVSAKITVDGVDYAGAVDAQNGTFTFTLPADAVTAGNSYAGTLAVSVGGADYTKDVRLVQGTLKIDGKADWIAESAAALGATGVWAGEGAEARDGVIAVSNALFTAAAPSPANAVVTLSSTFRFGAAAGEDFTAAALAGVKVVKAGKVNRYAFLTGAGVVTNLEAVAEVSRPVGVTVTVDTVARTVGYSVDGTAFGPFPGVAGKDVVSKVRYTGVTDVAALDGAYRAEVLDANLAKVGNAEYATVAAALAAGGAEAVELLWDASWTPPATGNYTIAPNGHSLAIGGTLAYAVTDNGDGTITVSVTGGGTPEAPVAASITLAGGTARVTVANPQANLWYALGKTADLTQDFAVDDSTWTSGAALLAGTGALAITLGEGETKAFYRVVISETDPTQK